MTTSTQEDRPKSDSTTMADSPAGGLRRFAAVFAEPRVRRAMIGAFLARLAQGMYAMALLLLLQGRLDSFAVAGAVVAGYGLASAAFSPALGRLIDRHGARVLVICAVLGPLGVVLLVTAAMYGQVAGVWAGALLAGAAQPPISSTLRAFVSESFDRAETRAAAYSLDAISTEVTFVAGPAIVGAAIAWAAPELALLGGSLFTLAGTFLFLAARPCAADRRRQPSADEPHDPLRSNRTVWTISATALLQMLAIGMVEVGAAARAVELDSPARTGVLLSAWALGSVAGGLGYGATSWAWPIRAQYGLLMALSGVGFAAVSLASGFAGLVPLMFIAGLAVAPTATVAASVLGNSVPAGARTEAFTWFASANALGGAAGYLLAGSLAELLSARPVLLTAAALLLLGAPISLALPRKS
ncbi:MFS transporter [Streptomyces sp. NPDC056159]|uniref:MFS transporter n=1 Tax=Streptomyces sp. NPDC056159 TaxID=3155537 RepID=UPI0034333D9B